ncbi:hypothetical protein NCAS_0C03390 [Naumovozyma castellii]|uniref:Uncharacterized protein n=1 Tax=Naumovozyma castellii TaxID=27288 RepID=G0VCW8_NAUCA|nr:hypothetical protein NCAS_0C03390 [Naumovozyma castellii CBS 4309]CCC69329.1 hypothetical protein NCAS_0C03390 [Naumovozyma castellii CBS 4309]
MQFSTVATIATVAAVASAAANVTTATTHKDVTTLVTITDCENHVCKETVSPALVSTATVTVNNEVTEYTTYCPLSTTAAPAKNVTSSAAAPAKNTTTTATKTNTISSHFSGAAGKALPAAGALMAGVAALLL